MTYQMSVKILQSSWSSKMPTHPKIPTSKLLYNGGLQAPQAFRRDIDDENPTAPPTGSIKPVSNQPAEARPSSHNHHGADSVRRRDQRRTGQQNGAVGIKGETSYRGSSLKDPAEDGILRRAQNDEGARWRVGEESGRARDRERVPGSEADGADVK